MTAKPITDDFWILEKNGERIGILQKTEAGVTITSKKQKENFKNLSQLKSRYNIKFTTTSKNNVDKFEINGYPTNSKPYNMLYDVKRKISIFTKTEKSKSFYCAGYYIIKFDNGWVKSFCPKLITIQRYKNKGPFSTQLEMQEQLRLTKYDDTY